MQIRTGFGVDVHRLAVGYDLFIGGKKIESDLGAV
jgi:2C-methyl-D-erythritol 2,4-cyclodiphosphate synthase